MPAAAEYLPGAQFWHSEPEVENWPAGHWVQELDPAVELDPAGHLVHPDPAVENHPAGQVVHVVEPATDPVPAGQSEQEGDPEVAYSLASHL